MKKRTKRGQNRFYRSIMQWAYDCVLLKSKDKIIIINANKLIINAVWFDALVDKAKIFNH
jgi:hypothetical protein